MNLAVSDWLLEAARVRARRSQQRRAIPVAAGLLDLASNDYLSLSKDPRLILAATTALQLSGTGACASRVVSGTLPVHEELEGELCQLTGQEAALVFSSGYLANLGVLGSLGGPNTLIVLDAHCHASLFDAARLSRSPLITAPHADLAALEHSLAGRSAKRAVVVVESVYSVLGDLADLSSIAELCARYDALLLVDEAHGLGVMGAGRGLVHALGLADLEYLVVTATLSKALAAQGGVVLAKRMFREQLVNTARSFIFDTGLAPASAAAAAEACRIIRAEPERVESLHQIAEQISMGIQLRKAPGAVQSVVVGGAEQAVEITAELRNHGILVGCFRPPSVPDGVSRLRLTAHAGADQAEVVAATAFLRELIGGNCQRPKDRQ
ncbi:aminotransferase class I/II-fold pyridoxal phosphate-dependent enzyme [Psychromicrobium lacuslunae]|uniref:8-amino-7-oxononanoate synthase n=1 Tax=Psychromicrobium lacuslunae TaxID=1618207 RepID=A0A0D4BZQ2_9MICC|nr:8-amino-7-oxononanoate synthase [Psychromicrobium lacuslunae]AJT41794.1 8-amino-7-oxononanoate synthase [Psychromicrobium lacuslunae]